MTNAKVGYKSPPAHTRFKKGVSGNRKGRPPGRKRKTAIECFEETLARRITVKTAKGEVRMSSLDALIQSQVQKALKGDRYATKVVFDLVKGLGEFDAPKTKERVGVVVLHRPCATNEEFMARYKDQRLPLDPLEGLPGIDREALKGRPLREAKISPGADEDED